MKTSSICLVAGLVILSGCGTAVPVGGGTAPTSNVSALGGVTAESARSGEAPSESGAPAMPPPGTSVSAGAAVQAGVPSATSDLRSDIAWIDNACASDRSDFYCSDQHASHEAVPGVREMGTKWCGKFASLLGRNTKRDWALGPIVVDTSPEYLNLFSLHCDFTQSANARESAHVTIERISNNSLDGRIKQNSADSGKPIRVQREPDVYLRPEDPSHHTWVVMGEYYVDVQAYQAEGLVETVTAISSLLAK